MSNEHPEPTDPRLEALRARRPPNKGIPPWLSKPTASTLDLETVNYASILAAAEPLLKTARRLAQWEHDGQIGDAGADLLLAMGSQWTILINVLSSDGFVGPKTSRLHEDKRKDTLYRALNDLANDVPQRKLAHGVFASRLAVAVELLREVVPSDPPPAANVEYVTLDQMAAIVGKHKRTLERLKTRKKNRLPDPDVEGGAGKADEWLWSQIRTWLEREYRKQLPEHFPRIR